MEIDHIKNQYELKELELNSLLEVTQSINNNLPEESLYKIYNFTLRANLNIRKLALYVFDEEASRWECKANFGTHTDFTDHLFDEYFLSIEDITRLNDTQPTGLFAEFDMVVPVSHKDRRLAMVFVSGLDTDGHTISTTFIQALSNIIIVAIENKKLARKQLAQEAIRKEMEIARQVQQFLFPKNLPQQEGLQVEASYIPHHSVGGDYYDFIQLTARHFLVCVGDVSGKGVPAALLMSNFQAALRTITRQTMNLKEIVSELNYQATQSANGENFITFFIAIYHQEERTLRYVNAGHNPPVLIDANRQVHLLEQGTLVLGSFYPLPFLHEGYIENLDSFSFFAYTDGLTETFNDKEEAFGLERLQQYLADNVCKELKEIHQDLFKELDDFNGDTEYADDVTFLSLKVNTALLKVA